MRPAHITVPITPTKYRIKDFNPINREADLVDKIFEVENPSGSATDHNYQVSFATVVQAVANNLPGGNNAKVAVKTARCYDTANPFYSPGDETLVGLNPEFLCLQTTCRVEFPHVEYVLVYDGTPGATLQVWRDGDYTGQKIGAKWVDVNSLEARVQGIVDYSPFAFSYDAGDNVKYTLNGTLRLFTAKINLVKSTFTPQQIPAPTGLASDPNWAEINGGSGVVVGDFLPGAYQRHEIVVFNHKLYRAKQALVIGDFINQAGTFDNFPDPDYWEIVGDGTGSATPPYNDGPLTVRVTALEGATDYLSTTLGENYTELSHRLDSVVSTAPDYVPAAYVKDQLVTNTGVLYKAKQDIQNSQVAPTATNAYWLQLSISGATVQNSLTPASASVAPSVDAVNGAISGVQSITQTIDGRIAELEAISYIDYRQENNVISGTFDATDGISTVITGNATMRLGKSIDYKGVLCGLRVPAGLTPVTITISGAGILDGGTTSFEMKGGDWRVIRKAPSSNTTNQYQTILQGGKTGSMHRAGTTISFDQQAEYNPIYSGTFTVDDSTKVIGAVVSVYLGPSATAPTIPATGYQLVSGSYTAGANLMYMFKVGANGSIQYTITTLT